MDSSTLAVSKMAVSNLSQHKNTQKKLAEYQKNMKLFIQTVQKQTAALIDRYENQIKQLKDQIQRLSSELAKKNNASHGFDFGLGVESRMTGDCFSPIKHRGEGLSGIDTARSNFFQELPIKNYFQSEINNLQNIKKDFSYKFELVKTSQKLNKSRFEAENKKKRQRQQDLLHYLETGRNNLETNTQKMFSLIGKSRKSNEKKNQQNEQDVQIDSPKKKKSSEIHNASLSSICDSLNNSFHGKKAQAKSLKKKKEKQSKQLQQSRKQEEVQKKKKEQGIKNLLSTMRNNISSSLEKPAQVIKGSKLLSTGDYKGKTTQAASKGKVMINPIPIDLKQRNKQKQLNSTSPSKQPQSILKNSTANFLTKSIENISAISFYSEGGDQ